MYKGNKLYYPLLALISLHFAFVYTNTLAPAFNYHAYAQGTVAGPYQTRLLFSLVFRALLHVLPARTPLPGNMDDPLICAMLPIVAASLLFATDAVRRTCTALGVGADRAALFSVAVPWMAYVHFDVSPEIRVQTPYDVPQVLLFALAWLGIVRRSRPLFYAAFLIACVNRETALLLIPMWLIFRFDDDQRPRMVIVAEAAILTGVWAVVRLVSIRFYSGPHQALTFHLRQNLHFLLNPLHWITMLSVFGFLGIPLAFYFGDLRIRPMRQTAWLALPWFVLMCIVGDLLEIRIHSEWIPYVAISLALIASRRLPALRGSRGGLPGERGASGPGRIDLER